MAKKASIGDLMIAYMKDQHPNDPLPDPDKIDDELLEEMIDRLPAWCADHGLTREYEKAYEEMLRGEAEAELQKMAPEDLKRLGAIMMLEKSGKITSEEAGELVRPIQEKYIQTIRGFAGALESRKPGWHESN
jgi:hypothetical protein